MLPTTLIATLLAFVGFPFWVAGIADVFVGNISTTTILNSTRLDVVLLFIPTPTGGFGLIFLWRAYLPWLRKQDIINHRRIIIGIWSGVFASLHLLFLNLAILPLILPATAYALMKLRSLPKHAEIRIALKINAQITPNLATYFQAHHAPNNPIWTLPASGE